MTIITTCGRILKPVLFNAMDKAKLSKLEAKLQKTEETVRNVLLDIEQMKAELIILKTMNIIESSTVMQKRAYSTNSLNENVDNISPNASKKTKYSFDKNGDYVVVYTDGACTNNGKSGARAGIGVWFGMDHPLNTAKRCEGRQTNNTAEILACAEACKLAAENGIDKLQINTDSQFVISCLTKWIHGWKRNGWMNTSGKPVVNKDDLIILETYAQALKHVKYEHVNGHVGILGNEEADKLAVQGSSMP